MVVLPVRLVNVGYLGWVPKQKTNKQMPINAISTHLYLKKNA